METCCWGLVVVLTGNGMEDLALPMHLTIQVIYFFTFRLLLIHDLRCIL